MCWQVQHAVCWIVLQDRPVFVCARSCYRNVPVVPTLSFDRLSLSASRLQPSSVSFSRFLQTGEKMAATNTHKHNAAQQCRCGQHMTTSCACETPSAPNQRGHRKLPPPLMLQNNL